MGNSLVIWDVGYGENRRRMGHGGGSWGECGLLEEAWDLRKGT